MDTSMNRDFVDKKLDTVKGQDLEAIFHDLRRQVI
jgi:hypothetical protein